MALIEQYYLQALFILNKLLQFVGEDRVITDQCKDKDEDKSALAQISTRKVEEGVAFFTSSVEVKTSNSNQLVNLLQCCFFHQSCLSIVSSSFVI